MTAARPAAKRKPRARKIPETLDPVDVARENQFFLVPAGTLQATVTILAQLPYQNVSTILNELLALDPLTVQTVPMDASLSPDPT